MNTVTIGMDLGDKKHQIHVLDSNGETIKVCRISNTARVIEKFYRRYPDAVVAIEASPHSPWISRLLEKSVTRVLVGNPRKLRQG